MKYSIEVTEKHRLFTGSYAFCDTVSKKGEVLIIPGGSYENEVLLTRSPASPLQVIKREDRPLPLRFTELDDGTFLALGSGNAAFHSLADKNQDPMPFILAIYRAASFDDVAEGRIETSFCFVDIPGLCTGYGDSGDRFAGFVATGLIQMSNGDIYADMYGHFSDDDVLCPYFREYGKYDFYLYRTWGLVSHDNGKTFEFVSTVADVGTYPIADINAEGYCETDTFEVEPGHLVSVIRTGGHEVYSPLYCTHSYDFGVTWEAPFEICSWGVLPKLLRMSDGTLVCLSGHIHTMLLFSHDMGRTWSEPCIIEECDGKWDKSPSGYNSAYESAPGELTVIYDDPKEGIAENAEPGRLRNVYLAKCKVIKH